MELTTEQFKHCDLVEAAGRIDSQAAPQLAEALNISLKQGDSRSCST